MPVPTPAAGGRSGVASIETPQDKALEAFQWSQAAKVLESLGRVEPLVRELLADPKNRFRVRENSHILFQIDTDTTGAGAASQQGVKIDVRSKFGGIPASSLRVIGVGGAAATLQLNINGEGWIPVAAGADFPNETINDLLVRATTAGAGLALIRIGARIDPPF